MAQYDIENFESLLNSFLSAPIPDLGGEAPATKTNVHSPSSSPDLQQSPPVATVVLENGIKVQQQQQQQQHSVSQSVSEASVHSSGCSLYPPTSSLGFGLSENIFQSLMSTDKPVITFPSNQHTNGVELFTIDSGTTNSENGAKNTSKAEKNRSAQKRFRERQKEKVSTLQEQYDKMNAQLQALTADNEKLQQRTNVLDKLVQVSEEHILSFNDDYGVTSIGSLPMPDMPAQVDAQNTIHKLGACSGLKKPRTQHANEIEEMKKLTPEMFIFKWKDYLRKVSGLLLYTETKNPDENALDQMSYLTCDVAWMCKHVTILNQDAMNKVRSFNMEEGVASIAEDSHWAYVVSQLKLTEQQVSDLKVVLRLYEGFMQKLMRERQSIIQEAAAVGKSSSGGYAWSQGSQRDHQVYDKLARTLRKQHGTFLIFKCFFFGQLLTLTQFAKVAVYSYPYFPDPLAVMMMAVYGRTGVLVPQGVLASN